MFQLKACLASTDRRLPPGSGASGFRWKAGHWKAGLVLALAVDAAAAEPADSSNCAEALKAMEGPSSGVPAEAAGEAVAIGEALGKIDSLIVEVEARIEGVWAEAEKVLDRADATDEPARRRRLEELYGKIAALAEGLEDQHAQLLASRDTLVAVCEKMRQ